MPTPSISLPNTNPYVVVAPVNDDGTVNTTGSQTIGDNSGTSSTASTNKNQLDKMDFLKLLTKQLQYQDPLSPMDNTDFISQMAQFSALEGTNNISKSIDNLDKSFKDSLQIQNLNAQSMNNASAVSLIGKQVRMKQDSVVRPLSGKTVPVHVHCGNQSSAIVSIVDADGAVVRSLEANKKDLSNASTVYWDGLADNGMPCKAGTYTLKVKGQETNKELYCFQEDRVAGVRYTDTGAMVKLSGQEIPIGKVMDIASGDAVNTPDTANVLSNGLLMLGKVVRYKNVNVSYTPEQGKTMTLNVNLGGFGRAIAQVKDAQGTVVQTFAVQGAEGNTAKVVLDCIDYNGNGPYTVGFVGDSPAYFYSEGTVQGVRMNNGVLYARVNGMEIAASEVLEIAVNGTSVPS